MIITISEVDKSCVKKMAFDKPDSDSDFKKLGLKPFQFEPIRKSFHTVPVEKVTETRAFNTHWCVCGNCKAMATDTESVCCFDEGAAPRKNSLVCPVYVKMSK